MNIAESKAGTTLTLQLDGRFDAANAPKLETTVNSLDGITELIFDLAKVEYISSAGLRIIAVANKHMQRQGYNMVVRNVNSSIMKVFEMTRFVNFLTIL